MKAASNTKKILEKIKALEIERSKLLTLRKDEIWNVLEASGGLTLDNKLLAGLAIYAGNPANTNSGLLKELKALADSAFPSRNRKNNKKQDGKTAVLEGSTKEGASHG